MVSKNEGWQLKMKNFMNISPGRKNIRKGMRGMGFIHSSHSRP